jgi:hypothetical protein
VRLRRAAVALTVFVIVTFVPVTSLFLNAHGLSLLNTPAGHVSQSLQHKLS